MLLLLMNMLQSFDKTLIKLFSLPDEIIEKILDMIYIVVLIEKCEYPVNTSRKLVPNSMGHYTCVLTHQYSAIPHGPVTLGTGHYYYERKHYYYTDIGHNLAPYSHFTESTFNLIKYLKWLVRKILIRIKPSIYIKNSDTHIIDEKDMVTFKLFTGNRIKSSVKKPVTQPFIRNVKQNTIIKSFKKHNEQLVDKPLHNVIKKNV